MKNPFAPFFLPFLICGFTHAGTVIRATPLGSPANNGLDWTEGTSLEHALAMATDGDEIWLRGGTSAPGGGVVDWNVTFTVPAGVSLYGGFAGTETARSQRDIAAHRTGLNGDLTGDDVEPSPFSSTDSGRRGINALNVLTLTGTSNVAVLDGFELRAGGIEMTGGRFTLTNLLSTRAYSTRATDCTALLVSQCVFQESDKMWVSNCNDCTVEFSAFHRGSGTGFSRDGTATIRACDFDGNREESHGAAIYAFGQAHLNVSGCRFVRHGLTARETRQGGAVWATDCPDLTFEDCVFRHNTADSGGALFLERCTARFDRVQFSDNTEDQLLGHGSKLTLTNAIFTGEDGAIGATAGTILAVVNSTFATPVAGVIGGSSATVRNCIVADPTHTFLTPVYHVDGSSTLSVSHSIVTGGVPGEGNLDVDPLLVGPLADSSGPDEIWETSDDVLANLRLRPGSPAIDAGSSAGALPLVDLDGLNRQIGVVDRGAYEFAPERPSHDSDGDGQPDILESVAGTDPFDVTNLFQIETTFTDGQFRLQWQPTVGRTYIVESSPDLTSWTESATFRATDASAFGASVTGTHFHRVRVRQGY